VGVSSSVSATINHHELTIDSDTKRPRGSKDAQTDSQSFVFVNTSRPAERDKSARRLVRSHVMTKYKRRVKLENNWNRKSRSQTSACLDESDRSASQADSIAANAFLWRSPLPSQPPGSLEPFVSYPVPMQPHMYKPMHNCGSPNLLFSPQV
jgi:hypothetical protein